ncbi:MAG: carboxypeptidase regulatory-like domain-containing protein [Thermoanaerobaculia bacterium]|nr:carboxypeptidase regulatory-like domain-containing protein [Thermoanaerobaculia bacterium]
MWCQVTALLLPLLLLSPPPSGTVSGRVSLLKSGVPRSDASNVAVWLEGVRLKAPAGGAVRGQMESAKKTFTPRLVVVSKEAGVEFPNSDPVFHNVFSVSGANRFDLGLYRSGTSKTRRFDAPGIVRVYCNIHPQMVGFVMVVDSDVSAVTGPDGTFRLPNVPQGTYTLRAWHEEGGESQTTVTVRPGQESPIALRLDVSGFRPAPHKNKYGKDYPPQAGLDDERY